MNSIGLWHKQSGGCSLVTMKLLSQELNAMTSGRAAVRRGDARGSRGFAGRRKSRTVTPGLGRLRRQCSSGLVGGSIIGGGDPAATGDGDQMNCCGSTTRRSF